MVIDEVNVFLYHLFK